MWGSLTPGIHLHIHGILVSFNSLFTSGLALLGKLFLIRNLVFGGLILRVCSFRVRIRSIVVISSAVLRLHLAFLLVALGVTLSLFISFWALG